MYNTIKKQVSLLNLEENIDLSYTGICKKREIDAAIANEIRVVEKLCKDGAHPNIMMILKHGWLNTDQYYFFDMELCAMNLENFIDADLKTVLRSQYLNPSFSDEDLQC